MWHPILRLPFNANIFFPSCGKFILKSSIRTNFKNKIIFAMTAIAGACIPREFWPRMKFLQIFTFVWDANQVCRTLLWSTALCFENAPIVNVWVVLWYCLCSLGIFNIAITQLYGARITRVGFWEKKSKQIGYRNKDYSVENRNEKIYSGGSKSRIHTSVQKKIIYSLVGWTFVYLMKHSACNLWALIFRNCLEIKETITHIL